MVWSCFAHLNHPASIILEIIIDKARPSNRCSSFPTVLAARFLYHDILNPAETAMDCAVNGVVSGVEPKTFGICVTLHVQEVLRTYNNNGYERSIAVLRFGGNFEVEDGLGLENTFGRVVCCFLRLCFMLVLLGLWTSINSLGSEDCSLFMSILALVSVDLVLSL